MFIAVPNADMVGVSRVFSDDVLVHGVLSHLPVHHNGYSVFLMWAQVLHEGEQLERHSHSFACARWSGNSADSGQLYSGFNVVSKKVEGDLLGAPKPPGSCVGRGTLGR